MTVIYAAYYQAQMEKNRKRNITIPLINCCCVCLNIADTWKDLLDVLFM